MVDAPNTCVVGAPGGKLAHCTSTRSLARPAVDSVLRTSAVLVIAKSAIVSPRRHLTLMAPDFLMVHASSARVLSTPGGSLRKARLLARQLVRRLIIFFEIPTTCSQE